MCLEREGRFLRGLEKGFRGYLEGVFGGFYKEILRWEVRGGRLGPTSNLAKLSNLYLKLVIAILI